MNHLRRIDSRGVSMIEALVALVVMSFGMLGLVGLQAQLRMNADTAKQRSEAVRIAQQQMEQLRGYGSIDGYTLVADVAAAAASTAGDTNTVYTLLTDIAPDLPSDAPIKDVQVSVSWTDRASEAQRLVLTSRIAGQSPAIAAATNTPADGGTARRPGGRNPGIPLSAADNGDGTSHFQPPGLGDVGWVFNNGTGIIISRCDAGFVTCTPVNMLLLSGYISFDTGASPNSEAPAGTAFDVAVSAVGTAPQQTVACSVQTLADSRYRAYYCALPLTLETVPSWSGSASMASLSASAPLAAASAASSASEYRVCRYTRVNDDVDGHVPNVDHPLHYVKLSNSLANQNYLIVRADTGTEERRCPQDNSTTPYLNGNTWDQQPARVP